MIIDPWGITLADVGNNVGMAITDINLSQLEQGIV
jgi:predicted amidohydrolase